MKKIVLLLVMLLFLLKSEINVAQALVCNDLVFFSLDQNCSHTIVPDEILEGTVFSNCIVELDKTLPLGNGPWVSAVLGPIDIGKTYQVRVKHLPSGNLCWGSIKVEDKLPPVLECGGLTTIDLNGGGPVSVTAANLSISAFEACGATTFVPAILQYDCNDLGVQTIQLTATDNSGNSSTCLHSILVANSESCEACVSSCPQSVTVSYDEGNADLLTAFQNNDDSAFDIFGAAWSAVACNPIDSFYDITYQSGTAGQSWFVRQWVWVTGSGQIINCEQAIVFPTTHTVTVQGKVYLDANDNCLSDSGEQPVNYFGLVITKLPSGTSQTIYPNPDGTYAIEVEFNVNDASAQLHLALPSNVNAVCPTALNIPNSTATSSYTFDIGLQSEGDCPAMQVNIGNMVTRRCFTNFFQVEYCNVGLDTAYGAFVTVNLDPLIQLESASLPFTVSGPDSLYTFQVGNVSPFSCGSIQIFAFVSCNAALGQTLCNEANVYPDAPCDGLWQGAEVAAKATCLGDSVSLKLWNKGSQDMADPLNYIVIEDFIMYRGDSFQLNSGDTITIKTPANGATWRIEAQQIPGFPISGFVAAAIEGCGGLNTPGVINAYGQSDNSITYDQECGEVVGSFDPNDKTAVPVGIGDDHIVRANEAIEYKIRFQNTGTAAAFKVVVVDTLSPLLDARTLELGTSSHPYHLEVYPGGILHFVFQPIVLPDSNANEVASHGYLQFRIMQQPDLPDGTRIENTAAIYFDQNEPVITNTAFHTIGYPIFLNTALSSTSQIHAPSCNGASDGTIYIAVTGGDGPYSFQWSNPNLQGDTLVGLAAGTYHLTLTDSHGVELLRTFALTDPAPISVTMSATPAIGNGSNGTASASATGGTGTFTYLWSNGATTANISGLSAGTYTALVTDANGCTESSTVVVTQTILPLLFTAQATNPLCHGAANGALNLAVTGGLLPYTFQWSNPALQGNILVGLPAGTYHLTLTDSQGTELLQSFELTDPAPVTVAMNATPAIGNDSNGTASASATGGTGAYSYLWSNGATTANISGLSAGIYTVIVTDVNGCTESNTVIVPQEILPLIYSVQTIYPRCFGGSDGALTISVTGGLQPYTFLWNNPALQGNTLLGLPAGNYGLTVTDSNGSQFEDIFVLTEPTPVTIDMSSTPAFGNQNDGSASSFAAGGAGVYSYLWNTGATTANLTGLSAGTYTVVVTDANGCTESNSVVVEEMVGTNEPGMLSNVQIWPNPAHDRLMLDLHEVLPHLLQLKMLSADGRVLRQFNAEELQPLLTLNLGKDQSAGVLLIVLYGRDGSISSRKIVIQ